MPHKSCRRSRTAASSNLKYQTPVDGFHMTDLPREVPVTVCMPVYNGALYVRDAIHSILNQTVIPQEIIVSDGGSSDGTENIVREEAKRARPNLIILPTK